MWWSGRPATTDEAIKFLGNMWGGSVAVICAPPRFGKTYLLKECDRLGIFGRRTLFDPHGKRDNPEALTGARRMREWAGFPVSVPEFVGQPGMLLGRHERLNILADRDPLDHDGLAEDAQKIFPYLWEFGDLTTIWEEAALYGHLTSKIMKSLATGGGHANPPPQRGMRGIFVTQRFGALPIDVRTCVSHLVLFAAGGDADRDQLRAVTGKEFVDAALRLKRTDYKPLLWCITEE